jgi:DNA-binding FadR family transcriptional regulator
MRKEAIAGWLLASKPRTNHARVVEQLGLAIVAGEFSVGDVLPGDPELQQRFEVSRSVLREAMKTLAAKGLVVAKSRIGTRVTDQCFWNLLDEDVLRWHFSSGVSAAFIDHLYDIRLLLEPAAAAYAAQRATADDCAQLRRFAAKLGAPEFDWQSQVEADLCFHLLLLLAGGNPFMESMVGFIRAALEGAFTLALKPPVPNRDAELRDTHMAIVEAVERGDPDAARAATENVVQLGRRSAIYAVQRAGQP